MHIPNNEIRKANFTILQNSSLVAPYIEEHMNIVRSENLGKSKTWIARHHIDTFTVWLRQKFMGDGTIDEQLQWLAKGPSITIMQYQGYEKNGYIFYTRA
jgi:ribosomal protein S18 acetylase RimI-like enzyme